MSDVLALVSRILMSAVFLVYGYQKFMDVSTITNLGGTKRIMDLIAGGAAAPAWLGYLVAAFELAGGLAVLVGFRTRFVALVLVLYLCVATYFGHPFWSLQSAARGANEAHFYKNLAIIAAYLLLIIAGPGRYSVDGRTRAI
jgi:putative oxidoreductase